MDPDNQGVIPDDSTDAAQPPAPAPAALNAADEATARHMEYVKQKVPTDMPPQTAGGVTAAQEQPQPASQPTGPSSPPTAGGVTATIQAPEGIQRVDLTNEQFNDLLRGTGGGFDQLMNAPGHAVQQAAQGQGQPIERRAMGMPSRAQWTMEHFGNNQNTAEQASQYLEPGETIQDQDGRTYSGTPGGNYTVSGGPNAFANPPDRSEDMTAPDKLVRDADGNYVVQSGRTGLTRPYNPGPPETGPITVTRAGMPQIYDRNTGGRLIRDAQGNLLNAPPPSVKVGAHNQTTYDNSSEQSNKSTNTNTTGTGARGTRGTGRGGTSQSQTNTSDQTNKQSSRTTSSTDASIGSDDAAFLSNQQKAEAQAQRGAFSNATRAAIAAYATMQKKYDTLVTQRGDAYTNSPEGKQDAQHLQELEKNLTGMIGGQQRPPQQQQGQEPAGETPSPTDIQYLQAHPEVAAAFDARFGQGASKRYTKGQ